jgi:hypothetical protein
MGEVGADKFIIEAKNFYMDFDAFGGNYKIGIQGNKLARGILFNDDASSMKIIYDVGESVTLPFTWIRVNEGEDMAAPTANVANEGDTDILIFAPKISFSKDMTLIPYLMYTHSQDFYEVDDGDNTLDGIMLNTFDNVDMYSVGVDFDMSMGDFSFYVTAIMNGGSATLDITDRPEYDMSGYLGLLGGSMSFGNVGLSAELGYASGDDDPTDEDMEGFVSPWGGWTQGEMVGGYFYFDEAPNTSEWNTWYARFVLDYTINDSMSMSALMSWCELNEGLIQTNFNNGVPTSTEEVNEFGLDLGFMFSYTIIEGVDWNTYAGYLIAGDAATLQVGAGPGGTNVQPDNDANPYAVATQLSVSW